MKILIILIPLFSIACSSNRVQLQPNAVNNQEITYVRGGVKLQAKSDLKAEISILDYSPENMVIGVSISNTTSNPILFSETNVSVFHKASEDEYPATIYTYDQLLADGKVDSTGNAILVGSTAASIGASLIPFGSVIYSIGNLAYNLGSQNTSTHQDRVDQLTYSQLGSNYLRQQTIEPGNKYSGVLKIGFDDDLASEDKVIFRVSVGENVETFNFICKEVLED